MLVKFNDNFCGKTIVVNSTSIQTMFIIPIANNFLFVIPISKNMLVCLSICRQCLRQTVKKTLEKYLINYPQIYFKNQNRFLENGLWITWSRPFRLKFVWSIHLKFINILIFQNYYWGTPLHKISNWQHIIAETLCEIF